MRGRERHLHTTCQLRHDDLQHEPGGKVEALLHPASLD